MVRKGLVLVDITALGAAVQFSLANHGVAILPPMDVIDSLAVVKALGFTPQVTMLDPWYNKGVGGVRDDYQAFILSLLRASAEISDHVFLWGFPEIIAPLVDKIPPSLSLVAWLTWFYKNNPSVIRGWRSSQNACLHLARPEARLYPENFLNDAQRALQMQGKLRYMPGPTSVIEAPLLVGFVGKNERTGHPAQKPIYVFEQLYLMATAAGDLIFDPMCGSGTTGEAARRLNRLAIISDHSEEYIQMCEARLGFRRVLAQPGDGVTQLDRDVSDQADALAPLQLKLLSSADHERD